MKLLERIKDRKIAKLAERARDKETNRREFCIQQAAYMCDECPADVIRVAE